MSMSGRREFAGTVVEISSSWYNNVNGRVGGSWPGTVVDIVHVGTSMSMVG